MQLTVRIVAILYVASVTFGGRIFGDTKLGQVQQQVNELELELKLMKEDPLDPENADPLDPKNAADPVPDGSEPAIPMGNIFLNKKKSENTGIESENMLFYTDDVTVATDEIESAGGHVGLQLGDDLLLAHVPTTSIASTFKSASTHIPESASVETMTYVKAYWKYREAKSMDAPKIQKWTDKTAPQAFARETPYSGEGDSPYTPTMTGVISQCILISSGPGSLAFSYNEVCNVISEVITGLIFWLEQAEENNVPLKFKVFYGVAPINAANPSSCPNAPVCHNVFAVPTINYFNFENNDQLAQYIKERGDADGAYLSFFSKYNQVHFAYAYFGGGPTYMQYSNDGWGPNQIDRVFAHETGHVFNSPDEYGGCNCRSEYGRGRCTDKNSNCISCTADQQDCIMGSNDLGLCEYTRRHIGWCD